MCKKEYIIYSSLIIIYLSGVTSGWSSVLDKDTDLYFKWKLDGGYEYYKNGESLSIIHDILPQDFDYGAFKNAQGIWVILHDSGDRSVNSSESSASFGFSTTAQLLDSVDVTYCIGGNSKIHIKNSLDKPPLYTLMPPDPLAFEFVTTHIPINPSNRFVVEGIVAGDDGFILIDRIAANYMETTTTHRTTPTPTAKPIVSLAPSCSSFIINLHLFFLLIHLTL